MTATRHDKRCRCGLYVGSNICECRIQAVRREVRDGRQFELAMALPVVRRVDRPREAVIVWAE